jgi:rubrerythrin
MCNDLYALEKEAHDTYEDFLVDLKDKKEIDIISGIHIDEERHMEIAQDMLKIAEGEKSEIK